MAVGDDTIEYLSCKLIQVMIMAIRRPEPERDHTDLRRRDDLEVAVLLQQLLRALCVGNLRRCVGL